MTFSCWLEEAVATNTWNHVVPVIHVHSANPVGWGRMEQAIESIQRFTRGCRTPRLRPETASRWDARPIDVLASSAANIAPAQLTQGEGVMKALRVGDRAVKGARSSTCDCRRSAERRD